MARIDRFNFFRTVSGVPTPADLRPGNIALNTVTGRAWMGNEDDPCTAVHEVGEYPVATHVALADPHTQYQKESERNANDGYAGLNGSGVIADAQLAASGVSAGSYGSATQVVAFTVDAKGRVTTAANTTIAITTSAVTPPGSTTQVFFNNGGAWGASANLTFDDSTKSFAINGGASGQTGHLEMTVNAGAKGVVLKNQNTTLTGYPIILYGSADEPYFYMTAGGSPRSPYTSARFPWYEGFNYHRLNFDTSGVWSIEGGSVGSTVAWVKYIAASNEFRIFDSTSTGYCSFVTTSGGDVTITPSGGDMEIVGTLTNTAGGATARVSRGLSVNVADSTTITTTAAETNFSETYTVPAGLLNVARRAMRVDVAGTNVGTVSTPTVTIRLKWGSTTLFACTAIRMSSTAGRWAASFIVVCRVTGASGTLSTTGDCVIGSTHSTTTRQDATVDLTASGTMQVSVQMSTSSASNTITLESAVYETINC